MKIFEDPEEFAKYLKKRNVEEVFVTLVRESAPEVSEVNFFVVATAEDGDEKLRLVLHTGTIDDRTGEEEAKSVIEATDSTYENLINSLKRMKFSVYKGEIY